MKDRPEVSEITFLARTDHASLAPGAIGLKRPNEYLWRQDIGDWFRLQSSYPNAIYTTFREFLQIKQPDVVYVHHFANMGIEILRELRRTLPNAFIALTLHEYMAICQRNGQMVKNNTKRLCYRESTEDCNLCFPEHSVQDFWLRKHFIQKHFEAADMFISPSEFLRQRYVDWGIPADYITVIENGQPELLGACRERAARAAQPVRLLRPGDRIQGRRSVAAGAAPDASAGAQVDAGRDPRRQPRSSRDNGCANWSRSCARR